MGSRAWALLPLLLPWVLRAGSLSPPLVLPLRVAATRGTALEPGTPAARADGLALALELGPGAPAAGALAMVDNLQGDAGRGYFLHVLAGSPPQQVGRLAPGAGGGRRSPERERLCLCFISRCRSALDSALMLHK
ncbi:beta-secretase 2-like [Erinaceus europaeus]|uniref:Beta-secretase 2-like n=1 Tax=Erinaceus europaeus TaxID=9365 RepID=A0ABM3WVT9_ERIEU|nr:beta-secretase 2-like [Erinaceus europaeus]